MKTFNSSIARVRNTNGEFVALSALRGLNSYELAVAAGFKGTEEEWMNSIIGDGWVGAFQQVDTRVTNIETELSNIPDITTVIAKNEEQDAAIFALETSISGITPASISAAALDSNGRVKSEQASSFRVDFSASGTLTLNHAGRFVLVNSSDAVTITIPLDSDAAWPDYTEIEICQWGTGSVTIEGVSGVGIVSLDNAKTIAGQYGCCCLKKTGGNTWLLSGALS